MKVHSISAGRPDGSPAFSRRAFVLGSAALLAGCASERLGQYGPTTYTPARGAIDPAYAGMYGRLQDGPFIIDGADLSQVDPQFYRQVVALPSYISNRPGQIVVDPERRHLHLVQNDGSAIRYGIGVGREGFEWSGSAQIRRKEEWPRWTPPPQMVQRDPKARPFAKGMPGGPENPLGARALYLYQGEKDTLYRIHGTNEPWSVGQAVSSGCIRLLNQDIIYLYQRVPVGTRVVVLGANASTA
jgi:lipoprotein-anchoring transpeptidase ErfK/SrfK